MNLIEMKKKALKLIEEISDSEKLTDDPDIEAKLNTTINLIMTEVARMKKIPSVIDIEVEEGQRLDLNTIDYFYQLETIKAKDNNKEYMEVDVTMNNAEFPKDGTATIYYWRKPTPIDEDTSDTEYEFELTDDALEVMVLGVAGTLLLSDVSSNYGQMYLSRYETMLNRLDPRYSTGSVYIETGIGDVI